MQIPLGPVTSSNNCRRPTFSQHQRPRMGDNGGIIWGILSLLYAVSLSFFRKMFRPILGELWGAIFWIFAGVRPRLARKLVRWWKNTRGDSNIRLKSSSIGRKSGKTLDPGPDNYLQVPLQRSLPQFFWLTTLIFFTIVSISPNIYHHQNFPPTTIAIIFFFNNHNHQIPTIMTIK